MAKKKTFEESMERLDEILAILEKNNQSLDETIKLFEEGLVLAGECDKQLSNFDNKIQELIKKKVDEE